MLDYLHDVCGLEPVSRVLSLGENEERLFLLLLVAIASVFALSIHEFGHAWMADKLGDPQPRKDKRVSLAPWAHLDLMGFLLMIATALIGFPVGWGKPVKTDPETYTVDRKVGVALVALAGPMMSIVGAVLLSVPARWLLQFLNENGGNLEPWALVTLIVTFFLAALTILISISQFIYNLIPLYPMDGAHVLASLLPTELSVVYVRIMKRFGMFIFLGLTASKMLSEFVAGIIVAIFRFLIGI